MLHLEDSYLKEVSAVVESVVDDRFVVLDKTCFYPAGGGQPSDEGVLLRGDEEFKVIFAKKLDGKISHEVDRPGLQPGDGVVARIDWPRRYKLMRTHTASHILSAIMHDEYAALITGNQLGVDRFRVDFSLDQFDRDLIDAAITKANGYIAQELDVSIKFMPRERALKDPSLVKLAGAMPPSIDTLRIVTIGDPARPVDRQADGGTHVRNTAEVGLIELVKADNKGKSNRRVYVRLKDEQ